MPGFLPQRKDTPVPYSSETIPRNSCSWPGLGQIAFWFTHPPYRIREYPNLGAAVLVRSLGWYRFKYILSIIPSMELYAKVTFGNRLATAGGFFHGLRGVASPRRPTRKNLPTLLAYLSRILVRLLCCNDSYTVHYAPVRARSRTNVLYDPGFAIRVNQSLLETRRGEPYPIDL
ncbi:MAG: hypothetical protein BECKG1743F_GA0114225_101414 [Candidatus Kentron sp. G]|nr:MAG: hypothetical protein BECKG1743F_GA0114225_101414 [Candidatus Kentron sp. G]